MSKLSQEFNEVLSELCWSLFTELGVRGVNRNHKDCLVQIEELVMLTAMGAQYDPRLLSEALDWLSRYHEWVSVNRLRALFQGLNEPSASDFSKFSAKVNSVSSAKWPFADEFEPYKGALSQKSVIPSFGNPSLLSLRLRSLFGPGSRADIMTFFLTRARTRYLASDLGEIGYTKRSLMTSLDHLAGSGIVSISEEGNKKYYKLKRERELLVVIGKLPLIAPPWSRILAVISEIKMLIPELERSSESTQGVILRRGLSRMEPLLPQLISPMLSNVANFEHDWKGIISFLRAISQGHFPQQWRVVSEFEGVVSQMFQELYQVDDCIDGIDTLQIEIESNPKLFKKSYKECYQLFLSFTKELEPKLKSFLDFPFHKIMDEPLSDIAHTYSKEKMPKLSKVLLSIKPGGHVDNTLQAVREFQNFAPALEDVRHFINTFKKRLQELYFVRTEAHLLTLPDKLYKRHQVIKLFEQGGN